MAPPYTVRLIRGPCGGTTKTLTPDEFAAGETTCKGAVYVYDGIKRPSGQLPHFTYRPGAPPPPSPGGQLADEGQALKGWSHLQRAINHDLPKALHASQQARHAALRSLAHARRVRH